MYTIVSLHVSEFQFYMVRLVVQDHFKDGFRFHIVL